MSEVEEALHLYVGKEVQIPARIVEIIESEMTAVVEVGEGVDVRRLNLYYHEFEPSNNLN